MERMSELTDYSKIGSFTKIQKWNVGGGRKSDLKMTKRKKKISKALKRVRKEICYQRRYTESMTENEINETNKLDLERQIRFILINLSWKDTNY